MKKKVTAIALCAALLAVAIVGLSLAYFTDTDTATNTFTVGKVDIELIEQQRNEGGTAIVDYVPGKVLMPIAGSAQGEKDGWGMPVADIYGDKIISVKNLESDAYVRVYVAVPEALVDSNASRAPLHANFANRVDLTGAGRWNTPGGQSTWNPDFLNWDWDAPIAPGFTTTIGGISYSVDVYTYKEVLTAGELTGAPILAGFYLDKRVDYDAETGKYFIKYAEDDIKFLDFDFSQPITIPVFAVGVQADGFDNAEDAFAAALPASYNPWATP